jgi:hypothetical protein
MKRLNNWGQPDAPELNGWVRVGEHVAYAFGALPGYAHDGLCVWHWCDMHLWKGREHFDAHPEEYRPHWSASGVGGHDLIEREPLTLSPSVYWPD